MIVNSENALTKPEHIRDVQWPKNPGDCVAKVYPKFRHVPVTTHIGFNLNH